MAGTTVSRTLHFALHRSALEATPDAPGPGSERPQALFVVRDVPAAAAPQPWIGAVVPKRWARRAVTRNAIKRQIYAVVQDFETTLPVAAHVVRLRTAFDRKAFPSAESDALKRAVRAELQRLFAGARA